MLPEKWAIKVTLENKRALEEFRAGSLGGDAYNGFVTSKPYYGVYLGLWIQNPSKEYTKISFQEFETYILKKTTNL